MEEETRKKRVKVAGLVLAVLVGLPGCFVCMSVYVYVFRAV